MLRILHTAAAGSMLCALFVSGALGSGGADDGTSTVPGQILVELMPGASADAVAQRYGCTVVDGIELWLLFVFQAPPNADVNALLAQMALDPEIESAEPHRRFEQPEGVQRTIADLDRAATPADFLAQPAATMVKTQAAHATQQGTGVVVAVLDTGFFFDQPVLRTRFVGRGADLLAGGDAAVKPNGLDDDGDGLIDEALHHGSFVAGLVHLAAPNARILPVRVLDEEGYGDAFALARGILYALQHGAKVINLSLSMKFPSKVVKKALRAAESLGVVLVAAAGNRNLQGVEFPASEDKVIAVGAIDEAMVKAAFSNFGSKVLVSAPGTRELSTMAEDGFGRWDGSSFSAPLVSGAAALLLERYPGLQPSEVADLLRSTAQPDHNPQEFAGMMGAGVVDLEALAASVTRDDTSLKLEEELDGTAGRWSPLEGATAYDWVRGEVERLRRTADGVDLGPVTCLANDSASTSSAGAPDAVLPAPGHAFFYVFRGDASYTPAGSYGRPSFGGQRSAGTGDCAVGP